MQPSPARPRSRCRSRPSLFVLALTASAFALLVSVAASHLHLAPDNDEACAVCAAFAGKIEGPSTYVPTVAVATVIHVAVAAPALRLAPPAPAYLWPPNCGPPQRV
ncbi:MAG TPA: hypothetical protein VG425_14510 [Casimicrobiaceae bacterium]|nr:hypothetical protein [Casimicrobiaceae bacterium]